jgi:hypothetical protein
MTKRKWSVRGGGVAILLALCGTCVVFVAKANRMITTYMNERQDYYPDAVPTLCDVDIWTPPLSEAAPMFVFTYCSKNYPNDHWWAVLSLTGIDQGCGHTDHIPDKLSHIVR